MLIPMQSEPANGWQRYFSNGFRPLFTACALQALVMMVLWLMYLGGAPLVGPAAWGPVAWHGHEMLFGFGGAAVGGFLLTAVAKWTGRPPVGGAPLVGLTLLWVAGRLLGWSGVDQLVLLLLANSGYWLLLTLLVGREILASGNRRNRIVVVALSVMTGFSVLFQLGVVDRIHLLHSQLLLLALLISLIGGRITPAFTRNWLLRRQQPVTRLPASFGWPDRIAVGLSIGATLAWILQLPAPLVGGLLVLAGVAQIIRLLRWRGLASVAEPLLFALHMGYGWVGLGFILLGLNAGWQQVPVTAGVHALGVGAMGGMILAVAARAALGHTNRELKAGRLMSLSFAVIQLAALVRIAAALLPALSLMLLMLSGTLWLLAFALFALRYLPILLGPEESLSQALQREKARALGR